MRLSTNLHLHFVFRQSKAMLPLFDLITTIYIFGTIMSLIDLMSYVCKIYERLTGLMSAVIIMYENYSNYSLWQLFVCLSIKLLET